MRDPARIERIVSKLARFWATSPDLRFGQLVFAVTPSRYYDPNGISIDPFHMEDDVFEAVLDGLLGESAPMPSTASSTDKPADKP